MTRLTLLLTACLLAACSSDDDNANGIGHADRIFCDDLQRAIIVAPDGRGTLIGLRSRDLDSECAERVATLIAYGRGDLDDGSVNIAETVDAALDTATLNAIETSIGHGALPKPGQRIAWSECTPQVVRGVFTNDDGWSWFEGHVEPTNGYTIGRHVVDAWWPDEREDAR